MPFEAFKVGDRVRVRSTRGVPGGACGVIHSTSYMVSSAYLVLFDGWHQVRLMHARDLERLTDESKPQLTA